MGAVQNFNSDFVGANSSTIYVTALGGWTALSCQAQMGGRRDKNCRPDTQDRTSAPLVP